MAVKIRLARFGTRGRPFYRIVVSDSRTPRDGRFIEQIGTYDPKGSKVTLDRDRVEHWQKHGAKATQITSELIRRFLEDTAQVGEVASH
jgi:small subunit ribosomal protein S16